MAWLSNGSSSRNWKPLAAMSPGAAYYADGGPSLSAGAAEFVPRVSAAEFVPGGATWAWQDNSWAPGAAAGPYGAGWSSLPQKEAPRVPAAGASACWFNADAYSTDTSSPRGSSIGDDDALGVGDSSTAPNSNAGANGDAAAVPILAKGSARDIVPGVESREQTPRSEPVCPNDAGLAVLPREDRKEEDGGHIDIVTEMTERTMKEWLRRFADDHDTGLMARQWQTWAEAIPETPKKTIHWLLRRGLDDCRVATPVAATLRALLHSEGTSGGASRIAREDVERELAEYSEEDLEDIVLDNPRAKEFVGEIRQLLLEAPALPAEGAAGHEPSQPCALAPAAAPVATATASAAAAALDIAEAVGASPEAEGHSYSRSFMLTVRTVDTHPEIRWRAQAVTGETPQWQMRRALPEARRDSRGSDSGAEWRDKARDRKPSGTLRGTVAPLAVSPTSWAAQIRKSKEVDDDTTADATFVRELRSTLNKLTVEKFEPLSERLIVQISESTRPNRGIPALMQLVFEKATTQHHFINMYVSLCVKLHRWLTENELSESQTKTSQTNFKRILLNQCQNSFEQYLEPPEGFDGLEGADLLEAQVKYKTKMLGNIRLVGELIRHGMLVPKIALSVAFELARDDPAVREERLETLAVFLETIGPLLDDPNWAHFAAFQGIFAEVERCIRSPELPSRIRFLLRDVMDLRRGGWQSRKVRALDADAPTTIAEVHQKARQTPSGCATPSWEATPGRGSRRHSAGTGTPNGAPASPSTPTRTSRGEVHRAAGGKVVTSKPARASPKGGPKASPKGRMSESPKSPKAAPVEALAESRSMQADAGIRAAVKPPSREELLKRFHMEVAQVIRQLGDSTAGLSLPSAVQRLKCCPLPGGCALEEAVDLLARVVDEPRACRKQLFALVSALFDEGVLSPKEVMVQAVEAFVEDALAEPDNADPPDLAEIVVAELLPATGLQLGALRLAQCVREALQSA
mmetsp:Transcript_60903/g.132109  ORF Transcript_60903/g.132109 Transcript_60903/m.132109 type:complete len:976 (-) Transcript_60903:111-3038(-)